MASNSDMSFDAALPKGKDVKDTQMLEPGGTEPASFVTGENILVRDTRKHGPFGGLGSRGWADNSND